MKLKKVKREKIIEGLVHFKFPNAYLMNATLLRAQEFCESPKFRGKAFTLEEYMDWYAGRKENKNEFSYFEVVEGMNFPGEIFEHFKYGMFDPLGMKEKEFLGMLGGDYPEYVIATAGNKAVMKHECAHGLYYLNKDYKKEVNQILSKLNLAPIYKMLKKKGYGRNTYKDEAHAYLVDPRALKEYKIYYKSYQKAHKKLLKIFNFYWKEMKT